MKSILPKTALCIFTLCLVAVLAACGKKETKPSAPPPVEVSVVTAASERVHRTTELPGRINSVREAQVSAPISGRIGKALVTEGALVSATEATQLAVIRQLDPVYFDFTQSSAEVLRLRRALEKGSFESASPGEARVTLILEDGTVYRH